MSARARVLCYLTGGALDGAPSPELVAASEAEHPTGAVCAYRDNGGTWRHVPDGQADHYRRVLDVSVLAVYVET